MRTLFIKYEKGLHPCSPVNNQLPNKSLDRHSFGPFCPRGPRGPSLRRFSMSDL